MAKRGIELAAKTGKPETNGGSAPSANADLKKATLIVAGLSILITGLATMMEGVEKLFNVSLKVMFAAASALVLFILWRKISAWWRRQPSDWGLSGGLTHPRYFRIHPYVDELEDRELYVERRLDESILQWLRNTKKPVVCLHGRPGAGKSSMLNAFVLPKLRRSGFITLVVRSYEDPTTCLRKVLLERGLILEYPNEFSPDPIKLLEEAAESAGEKRLFVVFDQFEEFLVKHGRRTAQLEEMRSLLEGVSDISKLRVLLVTRTGDAGTLSALGLLTPEEDVNIRKLGLFTREDAEQFLKRSGLEIGDKLTKSIIDQARKIENSKNITAEIQPVKLNMIGKALNAKPRFGQRVRMRSGMSALLDDYVHDCLIQDVGDNALPILRGMVPRTGLKRTASIREVAKETQSTEDYVRNVFSILSDKGLLRQVDPVKGSWELSHDFLGPLLNEALVGNWRSTLRQRVNRIAPWLGSVATLLVVSLYLAFSLHIERVERQAIDTLEQQGASVSRGSDGERTVAFSNTPRDTLAAFDAVRLLPGVRTLLLANTLVEDKDLEQLRGLSDLLRLDLRGCTQIGGGSLASLSGLTALEDLDLSGTRVTGPGLDLLKTLNRLQRLDLSKSEVDDDGLEYLKGLAHLPVLILNSNNRVSDAGLKHLRDLTRLEELDLSFTKIADPGLAHLTGLQNLLRLYLERTQVSDAGLEHVKLLTRLSELNLRYTKVTDLGLEHLAGLQDLKKLYLEGTQVSDAGLEHLKLLTKLNELDLRHTKVTDLGLEHLAYLRGLVKLFLEHSQVSDAGLEHLKLLTNLNELDLRHTRVTDLGLQHLTGLRNLVVLYVEGCRVSEQGIKRLRDSLPELRTDLFPKVTDKGVSKVS